MAFATIEAKREYHRKWRTANRDKCREYGKKHWHGMSSEQRKKKSAANARRHYKRKYGLSLDEWSRLFNRQDGVCAVCRIPNRTGRHGILYVDHCHTTGRVRGLLCSGCNIAIAALGDNENGLQRALDYLRGEGELQCGAHAQFRGTVFSP